MYDEVAEKYDLQFDFSLTAKQGVNKVILGKIRIALLGYKEDFPEVPYFAERLWIMCINHFRNKRNIDRREPAAQAIVSRRNRRRSRKQKVSTIILVFSYYFASPHFYFRGTGISISLMVIFNFACNEFPISRKK